MSLAATAAAAVLGASAPAWGQLRVVTMNASNSEANAVDPYPRNPWMQTILQAIGSTESDDPTIAGTSGITRPIDVLALQEVHSATETSEAYAALLNSMYPGANYQFSTLDGASTGSGTQGLVYNANSVQLIASKAVGVASSSSQPRRALRYQLRPVGYGESADIYLYNSHYKAGDTATDRDRREDEAINIRADADLIGNGTPAGLGNKNIIYLGDFNTYSSTEAGYQHLLSAGHGKANDPINKPGGWSDTSSFRNIHTQSPYNGTTADALGSSFNGTGGGVDDRFDIQLVSDETIDGDGVAYIPNSYNAFGNNGTHAINQPINDASNNWPNPEGGTPNSTVLNALAVVLDHLPVVADYQLPAKMSAGITGAGIPSQVITGGSVSVTLNVSNSAPVTVAAGADALTYIYASTGAASGSGSGTDAAAGGSNNHTITLNTTGIGAKTGNISATGTSEQVANGTFSQAVNYTVLDHADPSFLALSSDTAETIDFGYVPVGSAARTMPFSIYNRSGPNRAGLDLDSITNAGSTSALATDATTFSNLAANGAKFYNASLNPSVAGDFTATHTFALSDQNLPGAAARPSLVLTTKSRVFSVATFPVIGYMMIPPTEPLTTGSFSIGAGVTLTKTGQGVMTVNGPHNNGAGSHLVMKGGTATFNSDVGGPAGNPTLAITVEPNGTVNFNSTQHLASLAIQRGGEVNVTPGGNKVLVTRALDIAVGTLDLTDEDMAVDYDDGGPSPLDDVRRWIADGYNFAAWDGAGIISTAALNADPFTYALGYAENADLPLPYGTQLGGPSFFGVDVDATAVLVKYTWVGDVTLDGILDFQDLSIFNGNYDSGATTGRLWTEGDLNYDGTIDFQDLSLFNGGYDPSKPSLPEPASLGLLAAAWYAWGRRRRR